LLIAGEICGVLSRAPPFRTMTLSGLAPPTEWDLLLFFRDLEFDADGLIVEGDFSGGCAAAGWEAGSDWLVAGFCGCWSPEGFDSCWAVDACGASFW